MLTNGKLTWPERSKFLKNFQMITKDIGTVAKICVILSIMNDEDLLIFSFQKVTPPPGQMKNL